MNDLLKIIALESFSSPGTPHFRLDSPACYGLAGDYTRAIDEHTEADPIAILTQYIVSYGNVIGRNPYFVAEGDKHHLNLFMVLVGKSARGRKGSSWGHVRNAFAAVENSWVENNIKNGLSSGEGLIKVVSSLKGLDQDGEATYAKADKRLLIQEGEFGATLQMFRRDGNVLSPIMRNLWDNGTANILTRSEPLRVSDAHVSLVGHITQEELSRLLSNSEVTNGFSNRCLWTFSRRSKLLPEGGNIGAVNLRPLEQRLRKAIEFGRQVGQMRRDEEASQIWVEMYGVLTIEHAGMLGSVTARAEAQTMRLACLFALLDCSAVVKRPHLEAAFCLWSYCFASARYIFGGSGGDKHAVKIVDELTLVGEDGLTTSQISGLFGRNVPAAQLRSSLDALKAEGRVQSEKKPNSSGRPTEVWRLIPQQPQTDVIRTSELYSEAPTTKHELHEKVKFSANLPPLS